MRKISPAAMVLLAALAGCNEPAPKTPPAPPPAKDTIDIKAPGIDIQIEKDKKDDKASDVDVDVKAPGTEVKVDE